ncbi:unnamed protein product [Pleuronectes platessa]|uniref:Uncharacterized protein n=1 Tax=Pleuronectes platessa TaxID=8262 RepID=A0A9N7VRR4_PLEPL|nr:unnamed protein product [Pleuronectes platessa]
MKQESTAPTSAGQGWLTDKPVIQSEIWDLSKPGADVTGIRGDTFSPLGTLNYLLRRVLRQRNLLLKAGQQSSSWLIHPQLLQLLPDKHTKRISTLSKNVKIFLQEFQCVADK